MIQRWNASGWRLAAESSREICSVPKGRLSLGHEGSWKCEVSAKAEVGNKEEGLTCIGSQLHNDGLWRAE